MTTHIIGFKPANEKFNQMKAVYYACQSAGIEIPAQVERFFEGYKPDDAGVRVDTLPDNAIRNYFSNYENGIEVDLDQLPPDIRILRFYNAI